MIIILIISSANPDLSHQQIQTCITTAKLIILILPSCSAKQYISLHCTHLTCTKIHVKPADIQLPPLPKNPPQIKKPASHHTYKFSPEKKPNITYTYMHAETPKIKINEKKKPLPFGKSAILHLRQGTTPHNLTQRSHIALLLILQPHDGLLADLIFFVSNIPRPK